MSYRVEVRTVAQQTYTQEGPTCENLETASDLLSDILAWPVAWPEVLGVRVRDLSRNPAKKDPIIMSVERYRAS